MKNKQQGFTMIELLIVIVISSLIVAAISIFVGRIFNVYRTQQEQALITEDARHNSKRLADNIRNARNTAKKNGDEVYWLDLAEDYEIIFHGNVDQDSIVEKVHYYLDGTDLKRLVMKPNAAGEYAPGQGTTTVISRNIINLQEGVPLFRYRAAGSGSESELDPDTMSKASVRRIVIHLLVDANPNTSPSASTVTTQVTPRRIDDSAGVESERLEPIDIELPASGDQVNLTWQGLGTSDTISMLELNSRLSTYHNRRSTWQTRFEGNWRIKVLDDVIQPISMLLDDNCLAPAYDDISFVLDNCVPYEATDSNGDTVTYQAIFIYTDPDTGEIDYIRDIKVP